MAETPSITPLTNINGIVSAAVTTINNNFTAITTALDDVLSRSGVTPNQMETAIDMNGNTLLNLPSPANPTDPVRLEDVNAMQGGGSVTINNTIQGTNAVTSIAAVQALASPATVKTTILAAPGLTGVFNWSASNLSTQVTNDPAHAIYIPPTTDTTGASGAWVRQYSGPADFGWFGLTSGALVSGATATANSTALVNWSKWARYESSLGFGVDMYVEPGNYPWDMFTTGHFVGGIKNLHISGYQTVWQNITANSSWFFQWPVDWPGFLGNNSAPSGGKYLISNTQVGSLAFTAVTPSDFANLVVNDYVLLTSLDIEYTGYPPNAMWFEYPAITAINQYASATPSAITYNNASGILQITFATAPFGAAVGATLNGAYFTLSGMVSTGGTAPNGSWPIVATFTSGTIIQFQVPTGLGTLVFTSLGTLAASAAALIDRPIRFKHLSTYPDNPTNPNPAGAARVWLLKNNGGAGAILWDWNIEHIYEGLQVNEATGETNGQGYITNSGKYIEWRNSNIPGISPSVTSISKFVGCKFSLSPLGSQPDKLIDTCILEGNEVSGNLQFTAGTNTLIATGNLFGGFFAPGAKTNICNGNTIGALTPGSKNGISTSCVLNGGTVLNYTSEHFASGTSFVVGSGGIAYANGLFTFPWTNLVPAIPGMIMNWGQTSSLYSGDLGTMMVTSISGDATNLYAQTTCQFAAVPSFASNSVFIRRQQRLIVNGVSGCDQIRRASAASAAGFQEWELINEQLIGTTSAAGHAKAVGFPLNAMINVRQPCTVSSKTLTITMSLCQASAPATTENLVWTIDLTTLGKRTLNQTSIVSLGADTLTFNAVTATAFPVGWFLNGNAWPSWGLNYTPSALTSLQLPWVEMRMQFDPGMYFTVPVAQVDEGLLGTMIGIQGALP